MLVGSSILDTAPLLFDFLLRVRLDGLELITVVVFLEYGGDRDAYLLDQRPHVVAELLAATGRQAQGTWTFGVGKIIDVAPVVRRRLLTGAGARDFVDQFMTMAAGRTENEYVVAVALHADAEAQGLDGSLLSEVDQGRGSRLAALSAPLLEGFADFPQPCRRNGPTAGMCD